MHSDTSINKKLWTYYGELQQIKKKYVNHYFIIEKL